jgi:hypothetical protein
VESQTSTPSCDILPRVLCDDKYCATASWTVRVYVRTCVYLSRLCLAALNARRRRRSLIECNSDRWSSPRRVLFLRLAVSSRYAHIAHVPESDPNLPPVGMASRWKDVASSHPLDSLKFAIAPGFEVAINAARGKSTLSRIFCGASLFSR